jgi:hypothetical protein
LTLSIGFIASRRSKRSTSFAVNHFH